jgi:polyhydroxyalkanoate synthesis regulator phasin
MNYVEARQRLEKSTALRLLKADGASLCLGFLNAVFRVDRAVWRPQSEMIARLTTVLEEINDTEEGERRFPRPAREYLDKWISDGALLSRYNEDNELIYELTPEADQALLIFEGLESRPRQTIGAESKLRAITMTLREIADRANPDRDARIQALQDEVNKLTEQIQRLRAGEALVPDTPEQLIERYHFAVDVARQLLADFSLIRQRFLGLAKELAERHALAEAHRGAILARALDVHRELNEGTLGQSFNGFLEFLYSPESQQALFALIDQITRLEGIGEEEKRRRFLRRLPDNLLAEARSVVDQTRRLSAELRHMLDAETVASRRETREALAALRGLAYRLADQPPEADLLNLTRTYAETGDTENVLRHLWRAPDVVRPVGTPSAHRVSDEEKARALTMMAALPAIDIKRLHRQLAERFAAGDNAFRLTEMLEWYPPPAGNWLLDVVGYLEIARGKSSRHLVSADAGHPWVYIPPGRTEAARLPQIYFYK